MNPLKSLNILVVTGIFPPDIGGPASYVPKISEELIKPGHQLTVITLSDQLCHKDYYPFNLIRIKRGTFKPLRLIKTIRTIVKHGRKTDLLFVNGLALESVLANYFLKKPLVQKIVGDLAWEKSRNNNWTDDNIDQFQIKKYSLKIEALKRLRLFWVQKSDLIITPSKYLEKIITSWRVPIDKIRVIYNAVQEKHKTQQIPNISPFSGTNIICVGRLISLKKYDKVIECLSEIPNTRLILVGDGPEKQNLLNLTLRLNLSKRIIFVGQVPKDLVSSYLKVADIFVQNSIHEGFPHVVLEAMQAKIPVVATDVGGTGEVVKDGVTGLLIESGNMESLKKALVRLIQDKHLCERLVTNASEQLKNFSFEKVMEETEKSFIKLISERNED